MTTTNLHMPRAGRLRIWLAQRDPIALLAVAVFSFIILAAMLRSLAGGLGAPVAAVPTPALPMIIIATAPPTAAAQQVAHVQPAPARYVVAFAAPAGEVLGPIPAPAAGDVLARYGDGWLMIAWEASNVWIRAADLGMNMADLAPQLAPAVVYIQQPAVVQPYQVMNEPAAPAPAQPTPDAAPVVSERQQNIQNHYVQPPQATPFPQSAVTMEWNRIQLCSEHPEWNC